MPYLYLFIAIIAETVATSALKASAEFTKLYPSLLVVVGYGISFYFMALTMRYLPISITYGIWAGAGIILVALIGIVYFKEVPDLAAIIGMAFIIVGIVIIQLYSKTGQH